MIYNDCSKDRKWNSKEMNKNQSSNIVAIIRSPSSVISFLRKNDIEYILIIFAIYLSFAAGLSCLVSDLTSNLTAAELLSDGSMMSRIAYYSIAVALPLATVILAIQSAAHNIDQKKTFLKKAANNIKVIFFTLLFASSSAVYTAIGASATIQKVDQQRQAADMRASAAEQSALLYKKQFDNIQTHNDACENVGSWKRCSGDNNKLLQSEISNKILQSNLDAAEFIENKKPDALGETAALLGLKNEQGEYLMLAIRCIAVPLFMSMFFASFSYFVFQARYKVSGSSQSSRPVPAPIRVHSEEKTGTKAGTKNQKKFGFMKKNSKKPGVIEDSKLIEVCSQIKKDGLNITQDEVCKRAKIRKLAVSNNRNYNKIKERVNAKYTNNLREMK